MIQTTQIQYYNWEGGLYPIQIPLAKKETETGHNKTGQKHAWKKVSRQGQIVGLEKMSISQLILLFDWFE